MPQRLEGSEHVYFLSLGNPSLERQSDSLINGIPQVEGSDYETSSLFAFETDILPKRSVEFLGQIKTSSGEG